MKHRHGLAVLTPLLVGAQQDDMEAFRLSKVVNRIQVVRALAKVGNASTFDLSNGHMLACVSFFGNQTKRPNIHRDL